MEILNFITLYTKHTNIGLTLKPMFMSFFLKSAVFLFICISSITLKIQNRHVISPKIFAIDMFGLKCCLHSCMPC